MEEFAMVEGIGFLFCILVFVGIGLYQKIKVNSQFEHFDMSNVSIGKMAQDAGKCSKYQARKNMMAGKYNKDSNHVI